MRESRVTLVKREREEIQDPTVKQELKDLKAQREVRAQEAKLDPQDHSEIKGKLARLDLLVTQVVQVNISLHQHLRHVVQIDGDLENNNISYEQEQV